MGGLELNVSSTIGLLLAASLVVGLLADLLHLPKVTAYLLVGLVLGPSFLDAIPHEHADAFDPMLKLAMALVLFNLGSQFAFSRIRAIARRGLGLSLGENLFTFVIVTGGLILYGHPVDQSVLLGTLALATAPATTVLVLKEFRSEGPVTDKTGFLVAINNFASIVAFELAFLAILIARGSGETSPLAQLGLLFESIAGSLVLGAIAGFLVSYGCGFISTGRWLVLLVAATTFCLGLCETFDVPYMLTFLVMGVTVANTSEYNKRIVEELDHLTGLLCVLFFVVHGAEMDIHAFKATGVVGIVYIICRMLGKWLGIFSAAKIMKQPEEVKIWLGGCLFAQAGAAIALSTIAVNRDPDLGVPIQTIILGTVVFFEIVGPLSIRYSLLQSGEIPLAEAISHTSKTLVGQLRDLIDRFRVGLRSGSTMIAPIDLNIQTLIRQVRGIEESASLDDVIDHIEHSHDNTYAVVNTVGTVVGTISYPQLSNAMFDESVSQLVRAEDLAIPIDLLLHPDDTVAHALEAFNNIPDDCLPVVERAEPQLFLGVLRRSDLMHLLIQHQKKS
ncbi:cation:proton antiporter [Planctomicrobium sp.]|jgi:Kef-type K+ transport system membrane component KefB|nr:cation:proton antiporter [Planctomicrobium sp.]MBT5018726.1 CBS domain-containing protein [Planctomicrobium sp.]MDB4743053.1 cation:proton antiporter [Planctomicrobium sp.]